MSRRTQVWCINHVVGPDKRLEMRAMHGTGNSVEKKRRCREGWIVIFCLLVGAINRIFSKTDPYLFVKLPVSVTDTK
jgi:hypothetical protein